jgi:hypothetical protein
MSIKTLVTTLSVALVTWVAYSIWSWGWPVPVQWHLLERLDMNQDGTVDTWRFGTAKNGTADLVEIDRDHDGRVDQLQLGNPEIKTLDLSQEQPETSVRKRLAVCLDGVPYEAMAELWDRGYFREFSRPAKVISVFPSVSDLALTEVLHAEKVPGYENLYFDVQQNRITGGATSTVSKARIPYLEMLDYDEPGIFKGVAYVMPVKTYRADLGRFLKRYVGSDLAYYKAHICSTDAVCHVRTREEFSRYLIEVDALLREVYFRHQGKLDFIVFSDHGNSQVLSRQIDVERFLARNGFEVDSSIKKANSVVIPAFGLIGAMAVYCRPEATVTLAQIMSRCEGVDFCAYRNQEGVRIISPRGIGNIRADSSGTLLKYENEEGDPLELSPILRQLAQQGKIDSQGFVSSEVWFRATAEHQFPDAVNAIFRGLDNHVINRADLLVSLKDGYYYGSKFFKLIVTLQSAHGSLRKTSMTGFVMRNGPMGRDVLPARDVLNGLSQGEKD